jgi:hypothetical protein
MHHAQVKPRRVVIDLVVILDHQHDLEPMRRWCTGGP